MIGGVGAGAGTVGEVGADNVGEVGAASKVGEVAGADNVGEVIATGANVRGVGAGTVGEVGASIVGVTGTLLHGSIVSRMKKYANADPSLYCSLQKST